MSRNPPMTTGGLNVLGRVLYQEEKRKPSGPWRKNDTREPACDVKPEHILNKNEGLIGARMVARPGVIKATATLKGSTLATVPGTQGAVSVCGSGITGIVMTYQPQWYVEFVGVTMQATRYENIGTVAGPIWGAVLDRLVPLKLNSFGNSLLSQVPGQPTGNASTRQYNSQGADFVWAYDVAFDDPLIIDVDFGMPVEDGDIIVTDFCASVLALPDEYSESMKAKIGYMRR